MEIINSSKIRKLDQNHRLEDGLAALTNIGSNWPIEDVLTFKLVPVDEEVNCDFVEEIQLEGKESEPHLDNHDDELWEGSQTHIFELLPEIWENILPILSAVDFQSLINSSSHWRNLFKSEKARELLPLVLPILATHKSTTFESLLRWREVSRKSKRVIDRMLEESLSSPKIYYEDLTTLHREWSPMVVDENYPFRRIVERIKNRFKFTDCGSLGRFTAHMADVSSESVRGCLPFPPVLELLVEGDDIQLTTSLLAVYGHNVSVATLDVNSVSVPLVLSLLSHLPNLRVLKLKGLIVPMCFWSDMQQCRNLRLVHLEVLDMEQLNDHLSSLYGEDGFNASLLRHCGPQLRRLICSKEFFESQTVVRMLNAGFFPKLFCLRMDSNENTLGSVSRMKKLQLEEIQIVNRDNSNQNYFASHNIKMVMPVINTFAQTLTHLQLFIKIGVPRMTYDSDGDDDDDTSPGMLITFRISENSAHYWKMFESAGFAFCPTQMLEFRGAKLARGKLYLLS
ncbi:hypothetical protein Ocin01_17286 [Orchesella cincta]|uniref:F-box domain-containing protein n=1 Tax=Orchesella cincta TaxID=48709 RepID=A0A1D2M8Z1_ORCCI|nr:hypothetical protein Ocin01_17286 [Orchesella cincta]